MIVTSMQLTISSRRDIAVLQKESSSLEGEEDVKATSIEAHPRHARLEQTAKTRGRWMSQRRNLRTARRCTVLLEPMRKRLIAKTSTWR